MKKRSSVILGLILVLVIIIGGGYLLVQKWNRDFKAIVDRCIGYDPHWLGMLDCHGAISIWNDDNGKYDVAYNPQASLTIAEIKEVDDFQLVRGDMYLIDVRPVGACAIPTRGKYCRSFRVSGESKEFGYSGPDQIQTYLIINTKTGDERFYAGLKDAPETDRAIFQSLVAR